MSLVRKILESVLQEDYEDNNVPFVNASGTHDYETHRIHYNHLMYKGKSAGVDFDHKDEPTKDTLHKMGQLHRVGLLPSRPKIPGPAWDNESVQAAHADAIAHHRAGRQAGRDRMRADIEEHHAKALRTLGVYGD